MTSTAAKRLEETTLLEAAERATGLSDWGDDQSFRAGLRALVDAVEAMDPSPRDAAAASIIDILSVRLRLVQDEREHPEVTEIPVEQPVIVIGLPRSGTSVTYDLLALDPAARSPLEWEATMPWPAPTPTTYATDPRIAEAQARIDMLAQAAPSFMTMRNNHYSALTPAECNSMTSFHFASPNFWASFDVPDYVDWLTLERAPGKYRSHKRVLQQLAWHRFEGRWTLKGPEHAGDLEGLLSVYPDACLIQTHRHPRRSIASLADMVATLQQVVRPPVDPAEVGASTLRLWSRWYCRGVESRRNPAVDARVFDVAYRDIVRDPAGTLRGIHEHFGLPFSDEHARRISAFLAEHSQNKVGKHEYSLAAVGLTEADIEEAFAPYLDAYGDYLDEP